MPTISVIVPVHNAETTLPRTIDALLSQTLENIEIICIDDASTDNSLAIIKGYEQNYSDLRAITAPRQGAFLTRELGIANAKGEYIGFCDADDTPVPNMYEALLETAQKNNADIAVCAYNRVDAKTGKSAIEMNGFGSVSYDISSDKGWLVSVNTAV